MGRFELFSIMLSKSVYVAGETLVGAVNVKVRERLKIKCINLILVGDCRVHWNQQSRANNPKNELTLLSYTGFHYSFNQQINLFEFYLIYFVVKQLMKSICI